MPYTCRYDTYMKKAILKIFIQVPFNIPQMPFKSTYIGEICAHAQESETVDTGYLLILAL